MDLRELQDVECSSEYRCGSLFRFCCGHGKASSEVDAKNRFGMVLASLHGTPKAMEAVFGGGSLFFLDGFKAKVFSFFWAAKHMKITFIIPFPNLSGGIRVVAIYAKHLKTRGHDVLVVAARKKKESFSQKIRSLASWPHRNLCSNFKIPYFDEIGVPLKIVGHEGPVLESDLPDADIVIATWWETAEWVTTFSRDKGSKVYFLQGYEIFEYLPKKRVEATWRVPMHKIVVAQWLADLARSEYGNTAVSVVPNSVDISQFFSPPRGKQAITSVGMVYSDLPFKGCDICLAAFRIAAKKIPNLQLIAFGINKSSLDLPLPAGTSYFRQPDQTFLKEIYGKCDAWLFGSRSEGFGLPILEAMACRTPVIATPAGAAPELVGGGGGILVPPENPKEMARAIERIYYLSETDWRAMSEAAYLRANSYSWEDATTLFEKALRSAVLSDR